jgi:hypothetical protein
MKYLYSVFGLKRKELTGVFTMKIAVIVGTRPEIIKMACQSYEPCKDIQKWNSSSYTLGNTTMS